MAATKLNTTYSLTNRSNYFESSKSIYDFPKFIYSTTCLMLVLDGLSVILNLEIIITFIRRPRLITPFTIHIFILTIISLFMALTQMGPFLLIRNNYRDTLRGNRGVCSAFKYFEWTAGGGHILQYLIICLDRWIAVLKPVWYRTKTVTFGVTCAVISFIYQQVWFLPIFIADQLGPSPKVPLCELTQIFPMYQQVARIAVMLGPLAFLFLSYPILSLKIMSMQSSSNGGKVQQKPFDKDVKRQSCSLPAISVEVADRTTRDREKRSKRQLLLVLCLVALLLIFWSPLKIMVIMISLRFSFPHQNDLTTFFYSLPAAILFVDPLINLAFLPSLRREVLQHLGLAREMAVSRMATGMGDRTHVVNVDA